MPPLVSFNSVHERWLNFLFASDPVLSRIEINKRIINTYNVTLSTSDELISIPDILSIRYFKYDAGKSFSPSLYRILKCQSVRGQYPMVPTISPNISHEAPVRTRTIRFSRLVLFHIQPVRLNSISEV